MQIRKAINQDMEGIWEIFQQVISQGDTYVYDPTTPREKLPAHWFAPGMITFVAEEDGRITGTYFIKPNQLGLGAHIANCGYMVHPGFRGKGTGRALCEHSIEIAKANGFRGIQFNFVVSTNTHAIKLWERCGFGIIGTVPGGFRHQTLGYVDAYIMFLALTYDQ